MKKLIACALLSAASLASAGSLEPQAAPSPTFKTLQQIEPRTPLFDDMNGANQTIVIDAPGSYYLLGDIVTVGAEEAIRIEADYVTLDLNGFALRGNVEVVGQGILIDGSYATIRNGSVVGFSGHGIQCTPASRGTTLRDVHAIGNAGDGIRCNAMTASGGRAAGNFGVGLVCSSCLVSDMQFHGNNLSGVPISQLRVGDYAVLSNLAVDGSFLCTGANGRTLLVESEASMFDAVKCVPYRSP